MCCPLSDLYLHQNNLFFLTFFIHFIVLDFTATTTTTTAKLQHKRQFLLRASQIKPTNLKKTTKLQINLLLYEFMGCLKLWQQ